MTTAERQMRISEEYFVRTLRGSSATQAVSALANDWAPRAKAELPHFGLAAPEYFVTLCLIYSGEVGNGGHARFFLNRGGRIAGEAVAALDAVGLSQARDILVRASAAFPGGRVPTTPDAVEVLMAGPEAPSDDLLDELDRELWDAPVHDALLLYLRAHADEILLPERGR